jgi:hypothetical protein
VVKIICKAYGPKINIVGGRGASLWVQGSVKSPARMITSIVRQGKVIFCKGRRGRVVVSQVRKSGPGAPGDYFLGSGGPSS